MLSIALSLMNIHIFKLGLQSIVIFSSLLNYLLVVTCVFGPKLLNLFSKSVKLMHYSNGKSVQLLEKTKQCI